MYRLFLVLEGGGYSLLMVCERLIVVASLVVEHRLWGTRASVVAARGLSGCGLRAPECRLNSYGTWA